jgi:hypothetical protein
MPADVESEIQRYLSRLTFNSLVMFVQTVSAYALKVGDRGVIASHLDRLANELEGA